MLELTDYLKKKLNELGKTDKELKAFFQWSLDLKNENDYLKSPAYKANLILSAFGVKFADQKFKIQSYHLGKQCSFLIQAGDIIKIISDQKEMIIHLEKEKTSIDGVGYRTDKIKVYANFTKLLKEIFRGHPFLCRANRFTIINTIKYNQHGNELISKHIPEEKITVTNNFKTLVNRHYEWLSDNFHSIN
jgi:hypothetical protein